MSGFHVRTVSALLAMTALPLGAAQAIAADGSGCGAAGAAPLAVGTVASVAPGAPRTYSVALAANEGVIVDLADLKPKPASGESEGEESAASRPRGVRLCDTSGTLLAPLPSEVFEKGGSMVSIDDGQRLRFAAPRSGDYVIAVAAASEPREILVRRRSFGTSQSPVVAARIGGEQKGIASSKAPMVYSFSGTAGQWVQLKSTSEKDTLLRLAGPDRLGDYTVIGENDDSDGLNPMLRRKLAVTGTYYLQVDSLSEDPGEFTLSLKPTDAPKPPPAPAALRAGAPSAGRLADGDDIKMYSFAVLAGHSYRLDLTTAYDGALAIGMMSPVATDDGADKPDSGFSEIKSQDSLNGAGTEKLNFTASSSGQLLMRVKSFGIGETDGGFTLTATDLGG